MFSSAKCGSHGLSASLDSSYPSLMASAVGADRFWQIDLGVIESINNEQRAAERSAALFVFIILSCRRGPSNCWRTTWARLTTWLIHPSTSTSIQCSERLSVFVWIQNCYNHPWNYTGIEIKKLLDNAESLIVGWRLLQAFVIRVLHGTGHLLLD